MISLEEVKAQAADAQAKALLAKLQYEFAKAFPQLNCQANWELLVKAHRGQAITLDSLATLVQHPDVKRQLAVKSLQRVFNDEQRQREKEKQDAEIAKQQAQADDAKERVSLWHQIKSLLKVSPMMLEGEHKKYLLKSPSGEWIHPTEAMRTRLKTLQETSVFRGSSPDQLRSHLRSQRRQQTGYTDKNGVLFPLLPETVSAQQIRLMWDANQLRAGIHKFGSEQITKRLQQYQEN